MPLCSRFLVVDILAGREFEPGAIAGGLQLFALYNPADNDRDVPATGLSVNLRDGGPVNGIRFTKPLLAHLSRKCLPFAPVIAAWPCSHPCRTSPTTVVVTNSRSDADTRAD
jgi:hypothetical protein